MSNSSLLSVENLVIEFQQSDHWLRPVDGVSFQLKRGEIAGLVGESGSGKSLTCRGIADLLPRSGKSRISGTITINGKQWDVATPDRRSVTSDIAMVFQNPASFLDPLMPVWKQIAEPLMHHHGYRDREAYKEAITLMSKVGIPDPKRNARVYPHQLSGGMKQRIVIASALACRPKLLIADEPTTALDVTVQMQILRLLLKLREEENLSIIIVSHDLAVIGSLCDRVNVMYCGKLVEQGTRNEVLTTPAHPYTRALLHSSPMWDNHKNKIEAIPGQLPPLHDLPAGCRFHPRCAFATDQCRERSPGLVETTHCSEHKSACFHTEEVMKSHEITA